MLWNGAVGKFVALPVLLCAEVPLPLSFLGLFAVASCSSKAARALSVGFGFRLVALSMSVASNKLQICGLCLSFKLFECYVKWRLAI